MAKYFLGKLITVHITEIDNPTVKEALEISTKEEQELWAVEIQEKLNVLSEIFTWTPTTRK